MSYASQYVHPGMDDYWMSTGVHETWMNTHSLWQCIKCSFKYVVGLYKRLNGTFLSMFLTGLTPLAFNENRYHFVFDIAIINMAIGLAVIAYSLDLRISRYHHSYICSRKFNQVVRGAGNFFETIINSFKNGTIMTPACIKPAIRFYLIMVGIISFSDFVSKKKRMR